jgi:hypothetical protein
MATAKPDGSLTGLRLLVTDGGRFARLIYVRA